VPSARIVEALDEFEDGDACLGLGLEAMPVVTCDANDVFLTPAPASQIHHLPPGAPQNDVNVANAITVANLATPWHAGAFQNLFNLPP
jgi:hypothetical protein